MWRPAILQKAEAVLLDEKAAKLRGLARLLDDQLGPSFDIHLTGVAPDAPADARLAALQGALQPMADRIAAAFPNVGLGYFDARLDRIVAYAPGERLGYLVGVVPPPDHMGRLAMEAQAVRIAIGSMVRGDAMNCMQPIIRDGHSIGFAFANESVEDIYRQIQSGASRTGQGLELPTAFGLSGLAIFAGSSQCSAQTIREHLQEAVAQGLVEQAKALPLMHAMGQVEQYVRLFLDNLDVGLLIVDDQGRIPYGNEGALRLVGDDLQSQDWPAIANHLGLSALDLLPDNRLVHAVEVAGKPIDLLIAPLPGLPGYRLYLFEEPDRLRREGDYFERAERLALAGELATAIAHEIRNPLTVVAGSIQLIPDRLDDVAFLQSLSRIAGQELARVNRIIGGLLGFARYSEPERELLDLNALVRQAVEFLDWYAKKRDVDIEAELLPEALMVHGDADHLKQALVNLMMNGIQAMEPSGGTLTIRTDHPPGGRSARLSVTDEGRGISEEARSKIWQVFYSSKPGGTGLGLPVVHRIIDAHRGYIEVDSSPGAGTCFTVLLPISNLASV